MNLLDYLLAAIVLFCLIRGIFRGMIKEISGIIGVAGGFYAAYNYYPLLNVHLSRWIANPTYLNIISFLVILVGVYIGVAILAGILKYLIAIAFLGWADRIGGALLGAVKGLLVAIILVVVLTAFLPQNASLLSESIAARRSMTVGSALVQFTTVEMRQLFGTKLKGLEKIWQKKQI